METNIAAPCPQMNAWSHTLHLSAAGVITASVVKLKGLAVVAVESPWWHVHDLGSGVSSGTRAVRETEHGLLARTHA